MLRCLFTGPRSATLLADPDARYRIAPSCLSLNGEALRSIEENVFSVYSLLPSTHYTVELEGYGSIEFTTLPETVYMNVRKFGARGDGVHDDTAAIQTAINCCPEGGVVTIPKGTYPVLPLFLKSHLRLEIQKDAVLQLATDRSRFPILPGMLQTTDEKDDVNFGTWEGNPLDAFASCLTGMDVHDVMVFGEGTLDGQGDLGDWWVQHRIKRGAFRPRMIFLNRCRGMVFQGLTVRRSPAWNIHPYFSDDLDFFNLHVIAPSDSPNTDGFDPESCSRVRLMGVHFSVGDDCIAIKSGKIYMGSRYKTPCRQLEIAYCLMEDGHGGVTIGSEMAGGVEDVHIHHCDMVHTDRGLRIKTRRGRGVQGRIDRICMDHVSMRRVRVPLAVNSMYFCDPDGHSPYVQSRERMEVDDRTPSIGTISMEEVRAEQATNAGQVLGLPERPVEHLIMKHVDIAIDRESQPIACIMADGIAPTCRKGLVLENVACHDLDLQIHGQDGEAVEEVVHA